MYEGRLNAFVDCNLEHMLDADQYQTITGMLTAIAEKMLEIEVKVLQRPIVMAEDGQEKLN